MAIGTAILGLSNAVWALIEYWRLSTPIVPGMEYNVSGDYAPVHDLSIWVYLIPQFLSDLGQVGLWIGQTEWFYNEAPDSLKCSSVAIGAQLSHSLGSVVTTVASAAFGAWIGQVCLSPSCSRTICPFFFFLSYIQNNDVSILILKRRCLFGLQTNLDEGQFANFMWIWAAGAIVASGVLFAYEYVYTKRYTWTYEQHLKDVHAREHGKHVGVTKDFDDN